MGEQPEITPKAQASELAAIDPVTLTPIVQSALNSDTVELASWDCEQLPGGVGAGMAVHRFAGQARDQGQTVSWSLILKVLHPQVYGDDLSAWNYTSARRMPINPGGSMTCPVGWRRRAVSAPSNTRTGRVGSGWKTSPTRSARAGLWSTMASSPATSASSTGRTWRGDRYRTGRG
jgi:hypothetical protein